MKANEVDILIVPGPANADNSHWQSRWEAKLSTARRVERPGKAEPALEDWGAELVKAADNCRKPVVLVAHALGVPVAVYAAARQTGKICGGFFVAPPDAAKLKDTSGALPGFHVYPQDPLPFPSIVIASRDDPLGDFAMAEKLAAAWQSLFLDAGAAGAINAQSGHGPWPEGLMVFSQFLANLPEPAVIKAAAEQAGKTR